LSLVDNVLVSKLPPGFRTIRPLLHHFTTSTDVDFLLLLSVSAGTYRTVLCDSGSDPRWGWLGPETETNAL